MNNDELCHLIGFFLCCLFYHTENAYNVVQDFLSVYGLPTSDILDAFNKKNDAAAVSIRDLANICKYFIVIFVYSSCRCVCSSPLNYLIELQISFIYMSIILYFFRFCIWFLADFPITFLAHWRFHIIETK